MHSDLTIILRSRFLLGIFWNTVPFKVTLHKIVARIRSDEVNRPDNLFSKRKFYRNLLKNTKKLKYGQFNAYRICAWAISSSQN
jgi:hypothetical protein